MAQTPTQITPIEGWHVLHHFYDVDRTAWEKLDLPAQADRLNRFQQLVERVNQTPDTQLLLFSVVGRTGIGFMLLAPELNFIDGVEKDFSSSLGTQVLKTSYSFLSLTEESEYKTTDEEYAVSLGKEAGLVAGTPEFEAKMEEYRARMAKYRHERVYPKLGNWNIVCFYPMAKRRNVGQNWYGLDYEERRRLMAGHARVGRTYAGKVKQIITGSTGLSDWEWGVTLFANEISSIKSIVYEMRFDEVSHTYGEFGPFYIGINMTAQQLVERALPVVH